MPCLLLLRLLSPLTFHLHRLDPLLRSLLLLLLLLLSIWVRLHLLRLGSFWRRLGNWRWVFLVLRVLVCVYCCWCGLTGLVELLLLLLLNPKSVSPVVLATLQIFHINDSAARGGEVKPRLTPHFKFREDVAPDLLIGTRRRKLNHVGFITEGNVYSL